jgi:DNA-binding transcriptional MerR regulator
LGNRVFNQRAVNQIFRHVPIKTLRWWALQGLYGWVNEIEDKRGISREYDINNLYQLGIVENLSSLDIRLDVIKRIMEELDSTPPMDKIIFISKNPVKSKELGPIGDKLRKTPMFAWHYLIIRAEHLNEIMKHYRDRFQIAVIIVVDLLSIKVFVDSLVREF